MSAPLLLHASCVIVKDKGVLLLGPSGAGKSDLALRLIDRGAELVADDYVELKRSEDRLLASPPEQLKGKIEIRGIGICTVPFQSCAPVDLCVDLATPPERLPMPQFQDIAGIMVPQIAIIAQEASAPLKIEMALTHGTDIS